MKCLAIFGRFKRLLDESGTSLPPGDLIRCLCIGFLLSRSDYARWHMFDEKREAVLAVEKAVLPLMPLGGPRNRQENDDQHKALSAPSSSPPATQGVTTLSTVRP
jgi:hypothetical protein